MTDLDEIVAKIRSLDTFDIIENEVIEEYDYQAISTEMKEAKKMEISRLQ